MARAPAFPARMLNQVAIVYGEGVDGAYSLVLNAGLPCFVGLTLPGTGMTAVPMAHLRAGLSATRVIIWTDDWVMPETAQVVVDDLERYNVLTGTYKAMQWPLTGDILYRCCEIERCET